MVALLTPRERVLDRVLDECEQRHASMSDCEDHRDSCVSTPAFTGWTAGDDDADFAAAADAAAHGQQTALANLLDGLDVNHQHPLNGTTLLHEACAQGQCSAASLLISHGAEVNLANNAGFTPLMVASRWGGANTVRVLLSHGADVNLELPDGKTALDLALAARADSHAAASGGPRRSTERVDSVYLLQQAEDDAWEQEEARAQAQAEAEAEAEVAKATCLMSEASSKSMESLSLSGRSSKGGEAASAA